MARAASDFQPVPPFVVQAVIVRMVTPDLVQQAIQADGVLDLFGAVRLRLLCVMRHRYSASSGGTIFSNIAINCGRS